jgi:hypothetical protein
MGRTRTHCFRPLSHYLEPLRKDVESVESVVIQYVV